MRTSWLLLVLLGVAGGALAEAAVRVVDPGATRFWIAFAAVQILAVFGYSASSLPEWAKWKDITGGDVAIAERRLKILQGMVVALLAGNIAYYGGYYYFALAEIGCFIGAAVAAWGGDKFLTPLLQRLLEIFARVFGKSPTG